eukprot:Colp12_sorted_trinity150504_noHs@33959
MEPFSQSDVSDVGLEEDRVYEESSDGSMGSDELFNQLCRRIQSHPLYRSLLVPLVMIAHKNALVSPALDLEALRHLATEKYRSCYVIVADGSHRCTEDAILDECMVQRVRHQLFIIRMQEELKKSFGVLPGLQGNIVERPFLETSASGSLVGLVSPLDYERFAQRQKWVYERFANEEDQPPVSFSCGFIQELLTQLGSEVHDSIHTSKLKDSKRARVNKVYARQPTLERRRGVLPGWVVLILTEWLFAHRDFPYPSAAEKAELAQITNMSVNQVNSWFSNNRRRKLFPGLEGGTKSQEQALKDFIQMQKK